MFGKKEMTTYQSNVTAQMQQFAIKLQGGYDFDKNVRLLNEWCFEHNCIPLNFKIETTVILAVVKRI